MSLIWAGVLLGGFVPAGYARLDAAYGWPDLVVTDIWRGSNAICYEIRNIGDTPAAPGYSVALMVESTIVGYDVVPIELAYRQKYSACYAVGWDCTMASDEVTAIVDAFWEVPELDEDNNVLMEVWSSLRALFLRFVSMEAWQLLQGNIPSVMGGGETGNSSAPIAGEIR